MPSKPQAKARAGSATSAPPRQNLRSPTKQSEVAKKSPKSPARKSASKSTKKASQRKSSAVSSKISLSRASSESLPSPLPELAHPRTFAQSIITWFTASQRQLPWRATPRNAYHALVSEAMLQQTQVSRVVEKFNAFITLFPTVESLAAATSDQVTRAWAGLGYYRRANNLHRAAKMIVSDFGGVVPRDVADLLKLPGIGRYTAGAIASIAYNAPAPIVDGNVMRVLLRITANQSSQELPSTQRWAWDAATTLVEASNAAPAPNPSAFNEGLMELGATICTPGANPACHVCPVRQHCLAYTRNLQASIPQPKPSKPTQALCCACLVIPNSQGQVLFEKRPAGGLWSGLWQLPTLQTKPNEWPEVKDWLENTSRKDSVFHGVQFTYELAFERTLTHRRIRFEIWSCRPGVSSDRLCGSQPKARGNSSDQSSWRIGSSNHQTCGVERRFIELESAHTLGLSNAQREAVDLYAKATGSLFTR